MSRAPSKRSHQARANTFKRGDRVTWNSEAGWVTGEVQKKITSPMIFKGYTRHASKEEPQYVIESDKTDHLAIHKGSALKKMPKSVGHRRVKRRSPTSRRSRKSG